MTITPLPPYTTPFIDISAEDLEEIKTLLQQALDKVMAEMMEEIRNNPALSNLAKQLQENYPPRTLN